MKEAVSRVAGRAAVLHRDDIDTDALFPARFLRLTQRSGMGAYLFADWRDARRPEAAFMDDPVTIRVLVAPRNFGCGSSREQAVWALTDHGVQAILALSYGDIFRNNCVKNNVVAGVMAPDDHTALVRWLDDERGAREVTIDVRSCAASTEDGRRFPLQLADGHAERLLSAEDHIARTLRHEASIVAHERKVRMASPWLSSID
jgi:3-isopropylmalate/(R)-2-methylmalate dehydratase small subunit